MSQGSSFARHQRQNEIICDSCASAWKPILEAGREFLCLLIAKAATNMPKRTMSEQF